MHLLNGSQDWWSQNVLWLVLHCHFKVIRVVLFTQVEMKKLYGGTLSYIHLRSDLKCRTMCPIQLLLRFTSSWWWFSVYSLSVLSLHWEIAPKEDVTTLAYYGCILNSKGFYCHFNEIHRRGFGSEQGFFPAHTSTLHQGRCNTHRAMCTNIAYLRCQIIEAFMPPLPHPSYNKVYICSCANEIIASNNANTTCKSSQVILDTLQCKHSQLWLW